MAWRWSLTLVDADQSPLVARALHPQFGGAMEEVRALRTLGAYTSLTDLFLYNDLGTTADVEALLESPLPALTHLSLGTGSEEPAFLERLASTPSLPKLEELCLSGGPPRTSPAWDAITAAPFAVFLHGTRVTADYPKRTP